MPTSSASARYEGFGKPGKGTISTASGVLAGQPYGFGTRFEGQPGTNPEELIAAAHAACFTMATSFALARAGFEGGEIETKAKVALENSEAGFTITRSALALEAHVPGCDESQFIALAQEAKANCPVSRVLNCEITLEITFRS